MTTKNRIIKFLEHLEIGQSAFEKKVGISNGYINNLKDSIGSKIISKISIAYPNLNTLWLLTGEGEMLKSAVRASTDSQAANNDDGGTISGKLIPFYDIDAAAGVAYGIDMSPTSKPAALIEIGSVLRDSEAAIRVYGNSMVPNYPAGCIIATKHHTDSFIEPGRVYVIETRDNRYLKRLYYTDDKTALHCISDNNMKHDDGPRKGKLCYPDFEIPFEEVVRLHRVVGVIKRNIM